MKSDRIDFLVQEFANRLDQVGFTDDGIPEPEEAALIRDIWLSLNEDEQNDMVENLRKERAIELDTPPEFVPDQTPYAMRLLFYYLKQKRTGNFT